MGRGGGCSSEAKPCRAGRRGWQHCTVCRQRKEEEEEEEEDEEADNAVNPVNGGRRNTGRKGRFVAPTATGHPSVEALLSPIVRVRLHELGGTPCPARGVTHPRNATSNGV